MNIHRLYMCICTDIHKDRGIYIYIYIYIEREREREKERKRDIQIYRCVYVCVSFVYL